MKKKKLLYVPGLISLIGLPILLFFMDPGDRPGCVPLRLPSDEKDTPGILKFTREGFYRDIKGKKILTISMEEDVLDGNNSDYDQQTLFLLGRRFHFLSREIERLQFTNDTFSVLKARLGTPPPPSEWEIFKYRMQETMAEVYFVIKRNYVITIAFLLLILLPGVLWLGRRRRLAEQ